MWTSCVQQVVDQSEVVAGVLRVINDVGDLDR